MRAIIRFSLDNDKKSPLGNKLKKILDSSGFVKHAEKTATYEHPAITESKLKVVMGKFWKQAVAPENIAKIDHVWMYCDNPPAKGTGGK